MSSLSDTAETDLLKIIFNNTTWAGVGDATGLVGSTAAGSLYVALHTADPGEAGTQATSETTYTNYVRVAVARTVGGWTVTNDTVSNAAVVSFAECGATGATITHFSIGKTSSGATQIIVKAPLTASRTISTGTTPSFAIGALTTVAA